MRRQMGTVGQRYVCQITKGSTCGGWQDCGGVAGMHANCIKLLWAPGASSAGARLHATPSGGPSSTRGGHMLNSLGSHPHAAAKQLTVSQIISRREVCLHDGRVGQQQ